MLTELDRVDLAARGIEAAEIERQLDLFRHPPPPARLLRGCALGDGIEQIADPALCREAFARARRRGRLGKFVPASGAASRMFQALLARRGEIATTDEFARRAAAGDAASAIVAAVMRGAASLPFAGELRGALQRAGDDLDAAIAEGRVAALVDAMIGDGGLRLASLPKGLLPFHRYGEGARTAFAEHLDEATELLADEQGVTRLHFTVSAEHLAQFEEALRQARGQIEAGGRYRLRVAFSTQSPRTDTVAVGLDDCLVRDSQGHILFRPGGHGALLDNLASAGADIALVQNIDNIQPATGRPASLRWKQLLIGRVAHLEELRNDACRRGDTAAMRSFCETVGLEHVPVADADLPAFCDRPLRVCGVVRNTGEPGGGPFWVLDESGGVSRQIVESAQVDAGSTEQTAIFAASTHFNPVLLACALRDRSGRPHDLTHFVDPRAVFIARKSVGGVEIKALERPGLWNGAMAGWATVFVEVGEEAFTPVKTIADLLRPEHGNAP